jgi:iron complex outermembrane recepter protein
MKFTWFHLMPYRYLPEVVTLARRPAGSGIVELLGVGSLVISSIAICVASAFAQSAANPNAIASPAPAAASQTQTSPAVQGVEEIVVTAQKRAQLTQDVPIALTALTASTLQFRGIDALSDLTMQVPGMQFGVDTGSDQQIFIRGIGIDDPSGGVESPIATYVNGVYQTRTFRAPTLGIDVDRIEVLKGPQGTLFGRNATGGAINIALKPPSDELTATVKEGVGSYNSWLTQADVSGPLIKHILDLRIAGAFSRDSGWIENLSTSNTVNNHQEGDGRVALSYHPSDILSLDYDGLFGKAVGGGVPGAPTSIYIGSAAVQLKALPVVIPRSDYVTGDNPWKAKLGTFPFQGDMENTQNAGTIKYDFAPWVSLKSITAFQEHTLDGDKFNALGTAAPLENFGGRNIDDKTFTQEFNLGGTKELSWWETNQPFSWLVGAYYMHETYATSLDPVFATYNTTRIGSMGREKLNDYSVFGDTTIPLPWNFSLFGGVRYTYDRKALNQTFSVAVGPFSLDPLKTGPYSPNLDIPGTTCSGLEHVNNSHNLSPRVGMGWAPNDTINFYVKYSEGYNSGGNYGTVCQDSYKAETLDTVEGGVKGRWFDGRLVVDAAGYWNTFNDYQVVTETVQLGTFFTGLVNAPKAESWGGEFQVTAVPIDNFTATLGLSLMHSQYDTLFDIDPTNAAAGVQNLAGHQLQRAPNSTEQVGLEYDWQIPWRRVLGESGDGYLRLGPLRTRGEWYHTDYITFSPFGRTGPWPSPPVQNPYSIFNIYATLPIQDGRWSLRFFAKNFLAQKYYQYKLTTSYETFGVGGAPQWFGGDLTYKF